MRDMQFSDTFSSRRGRIGQVTLVWGQEVLMTLNTILRRPAITAAAVLSACSTVSAPPPAQSLTVDALRALPDQTYAIQPGDAELDFSVKPIGFPAVRGSFEGFDGSVKVKRAAEDMIDVKAVVHLGTVSFNSDWYENVVKSPAWFDVENHPDAVFVGSLAGWDGDGTGSVQGELTMKGITKPASFSIQLNCEVDDPCPVDAVGFSGEIEVSRREFNMTAYRGLVGDKVTLRFSGALVTEDEQIASVTP